MNVVTAITAQAIAPFRVEWRPLAQLGPIAAAWRALAACALEPNVFYEPAFALAAAPVFGADAGAALVWSHSQQLLGFFPLRTERRYGLPVPVLTGWTHPYAPLGVPLVDRGEGEAVIATWLDHMACGAGFPALMLLALVPETGPFANALAAVLARRHAASATFGHHCRALLAAGARRDGYVERAIGAKKRKELRRQRNRLADAGRLHIAAAREPSEIAGALADFLALEAAGWKGRAGTAAAKSESIRRFMESAVRDLAHEGNVRINRLCVAGRPVAAAVTLRSGGAAWTWKIAYDESFARASPGVQLMLDMTEGLLADTTLAQADSCATADHPMIDHLWRERLALSDRLIALRPTALPFGFLCRLEALRRGAIAMAKTLRDRLRG